MINPKYRQPLILTASAVVLIVLSCMITLLASHTFINNRNSSESAKKQALGIVSARPKFGAFAGTDLCQTTIKNKVQGKIITLYLDTRSARYDDYERTNTLLYILDVLPEDKPFLSEQLSTISLQAQCITSADDNHLVNLVVAPAEEM